MPSRIRSPRLATRLAAAGRRQAVEAVLDLVERGQEVQRQHDHDEGVGEGGQDRQPDAEHAAEELLGEVAAGDVVLGLLDDVVLLRPSARSAGCAGAGRTSPGRCWSARRPGRPPRARSRGRTAPARPRSRAPREHGERAPDAAAISHRTTGLRPKAMNSETTIRIRTELARRISPPSQYASSAPGGQQEAGDERVVVPGAALARPAGRRAGWRSVGVVRGRRRSAARGPGRQARLVAGPGNPHAQLSSSLPNPATTSRSAESCAVIESRRRVRRSTSAWRACSSRSESA